MPACPTCAFDNQPEARFCGQCGAALAAPPPTTVASPLLAPRPAAPTQPTDSPVGDGMKVGIAIATVFVPLLGLIMGIIFVQSAEPTRKAAGKLWLIIGIVAMVLSCICGLFIAAAGSGGY